MRRRAFLVAACALLYSSALFGEERVEFVDENGDGRKEAKIFYNEYGKVKAEVDVDGDGLVERFVKFKNGKRFTAEIDSDKDGQIDGWEFYNPKGIFIRSAKDTNHDGKPDQFKEMLKGRTLTMKESDRNFDGKIDKRQLNEWGMIKYGPNIPPTPGYVMLWKEEDNDFDGKIDVYRQKGNKNAGRDKIGKPMNPLTAKDTPAEKPPPPPPAQKSVKNWWDDRIKKLNERFGHSDQ